jgi:multisubunit Na+/H+ antiporter MnhC subunit
MKIVLKILFFIFIIVMIIGLYFQYIEENPIHKTILGLDILFMSFILMPLFIFYRYKKGKYKKYVIDSKSKNPFKIDDKSKL